MDLKRKHFYVNISSSDVGSYVETNTLSDFSSKLSIPLHFPSNEKWSVSLINMTIPKIEKNDIMQDVIYFTSPKVKSEGIISKLENNMTNMVRKSTRVYSLFIKITIYSHHKKMSVILPVHYLFAPNALLRIISSNCTHLLVFKSPVKKY